VSSEVVSHNTAAPDADVRSPAGRRTLLPLLMLSVIVGLCLGVASALPGFDLFLTGEEVAQPIHASMNDRVAPELPPADGPQPKVVVDNDTFDFGVRENKSEDSHTFVIRNEGDHPLELVLRKTSCKCTVGKLGDKVVDPEGGPVSITLAPGDQTELTLDWTVKRVHSNHFRQSALLLTNDREMPRLVLQITGRIAQTIFVTPNAFMFGKLLTADNRTGEITIESIRDEPLEISEAKLTTDATAEFFDFELEQLAPEDLHISGAKSGWRVRLTLKPGLQPGLIQQTIALATNLENRPTIELPVLGIIDSDFAIMGGKGWDSTLRKIKLGRVSRDTGAIRKLTIFVRGPLRDEIVLQPPVVTPKELIVTLGEPQGKGEAKSVQYPLTIEIPKGIRVMNHLGNDQGDFGRVTIATNHPEEPQLEIHLQFTTE